MSQVAKAKERASGNNCLTAATSCIILPFIILFYFSLCTHLGMVIGLKITIRD